MDWTSAPEFGRRKTLVGTLDILESRKQAGVEQVIIEVGTSELYCPDGLGNAMLAFGFYVDQMQGRAHAVDVREGAIAHSSEILAKYYPQAVPRVEFHRMDAFEYAAFVRSRTHECSLDRIDLIYYDAPSEPWTWYIELQDQWSFLQKSGALLLFDDTAPEAPFSGKGGALIPKLLGEGWRQVEVDGEPVFPMVLLEKL